MINFLSYETRKRNGNSVNGSAWSLEEKANHVPQQNNEYDCGVFMCKFIECIVNKTNVDDIQQRYMSIYRKKMLLDLVNYHPTQL